MNLDQHGLQSISYKLSVKNYTFLGGCCYTICEQSHKVLFQCNNISIFGKLNIFFVKMTTKHSIRVKSSLSHKIKLSKAKSAVGSYIVATESN